MDARRIPSLKLLTAKKFAIRAHGDQKYSTDFPYAFHLQAVENVLMTFGVYEENVRMGAWLHDVLEDTDTSYEDVETMFGPEVAKIVSLVTEPKGGNRQWRHEQAYPKIAKNVYAVILKLADRIANVEAAGKIEMYRKEHASFKRMLYDVNTSMPTTMAMWEYLDSIIV